MASFLLDGVMCPAWFGLVGNPLRVAYLYDTPEGQRDTEIRITNNVCLVPDDDGDSWTVADATEAMRGANMVLTVPDEAGGYTPAQLQAIYDRLNKAYHNQKRVFAEAGVTVPVYTPRPQEELDQAAPVDTRPTWQRLGYESKAAWANAGRPTE